GILRPQPMCASQQWEWQNIRFSQPPPPTRATHLTLGGGALIGSDMGEFGGKLAWQPTGGQAQTLIKDNVVAIEPAHGGGIVLFGRADMGLVRGYAGRVSQRSDGDDWCVTEVARLPSSAEALATIGPGLYAAWSGNLEVFQTVGHRVVVFSDKEILGLA